MNYIIRSPGWRQCWVLLVMFLFGGGPLFAQIGPYPPYPGGGYPPYGYPGGGVGLPIPRIPGQGRQPPNQTSQPQAQINYQGKLKNLDDKSLVLILDDGRTLNLKRNNKTKFYKDSKEIKPSVLQIGDHLSVDSTEDKQGYLYAIKVTFEKAATPEELASMKSKPGPDSPSQSSDDDRPRLKRANSPSESEPRPNAASPTDSPSVATGTTREASDAGPASSPVPASGAQADSVQSSPSSPQPPPQYGDDGPPRLHRGIPPPRPARPEVANQPVPEGPVAANSSGPSIDSGPRPVPIGADTEVPTGRPSYANRDPGKQPEDPFIEKARDATFTFSAKLPDFICQEFMARFARDTNVRGWQSLDVVSAEIIYEAGKESYRNLKINDRPTNRKIEELNGSWSTGEFATTLNDLFYPGTAARFRFGEETTIVGRPSRVYDFDVMKENSHWIVQMGSQSVTPAYKGSVWLDKATARVLRIEMQAADLPYGFPMDTVESAVDYSFVRIGGESVLLPVHAESLGCQRGSPSCSRNVIDFRNYRKYSADSKIIFDQDQ